MSLDRSLLIEELLALLSRYQDQSNMVVRLSFALGNLTAKNDDFRYCLFNAENAMETLLNVLRHHFVKSLQVGFFDQFCRQLAAQNL